MRGRLFVTGGCAVLGLASATFATISCYCDITASPCKTANVPPPTFPQNCWNDLSSATAPQTIAATQKGFNQRTLGVSFTCIYEYGTLTPSGKCTGDGVLLSWTISSSAASGQACFYNCDGGINDPGN